MNTLKKDCIFLSLADGYESCVDRIKGKLTKTKMYGQIGDQISTKYSNGGAFSNTTLNSHAHSLIDILS